MVETAVGHFAHGSVGDVFQKFIVSLAEDKQIRFVREALLHDGNQSIAGVRDTAAIDDLP